MTVTTALYYCSTSTAKATIPIVTTTSMTTGTTAGNKFSGYL